MSLLVLVRETGLDAQLRFALRSSTAFASNAKNSPQDCFLYALLPLRLQVPTLLKQQGTPFGVLYCFGAASDVKSEPKAEFSISSKVIVSVPSL